LASILKADLLDLMERRGRPTIGVDFGGFAPGTSEPGLRLLKNDLLIARPIEMRAVTSLIGLIDGLLGDFSRAYPVPVFRCASCQTLTTGRPDDRNPVRCAAMPASSPMSPIGRS
jgi:hypothetical protein